MMGTNLYFQLTENAALDLLELLERHLDESHLEYSYKQFQALAAIYEEMNEMGQKLEEEHDQEIQALKDERSHLQDQLDAMERERDEAQAELKALMSRYLNEDETP
jgi:seryl-tRNA synthetase